MKLFNSLFDDYSSIDDLLLFLENSAKQANDLINESLENDKCQPEDQPIINQNIAKTS